MDHLVTEKSMSSFHLVNVWRDVDGVGFNPMPHSLLWLPDGHSIGQPRPVFVFLHSWGGYPHDDFAQTFGPQLADRGFAFLSLSLRRRGGEGQLTSLPEHDRHDVRLAIDYLATNGFTDVYLIGEETGCWSAASYAAEGRDPRVKGICLVDPVDDLPDWLAASVGAKTYAAKLREAAVAARQGAGMDYRIDCLTDAGPLITMQAGAFLAWWSPQSLTRLSHVWQKTVVPTLIFAELESELPEFLREDSSDAHSVGRHYGAREQLLDLLGEGVWHLNGDPVDNTGLELVNIDTEDRSLYGFMWSPANIDSDVAVLLMHGLTSSPTSSLFLKMAPVLAQEVNVLAMESHRSGWSGHETALLDDELQDFDGWIDYLIARGIKRVVLAGASMGSLSAARYQSIRQHPNVVGIAHLMPTADCPEWFRAAAGEPYDEAVAAAEAAVADGDGETYLVDVDIRQPPPSLSRGRFRWTQRAASWLSWWGPDADSYTIEHIAAADVPLLLLSGTTDNYNDAERFAELKGAAANAPSVDEIWYEDVDHGLAGVELKVAGDLLEWLNRRCLD